MCERDKKQSASLWLFITPSLSLSISLGLAWLSRTDPFCQPTVTHETHPHTHTYIHRYAYVHNTHSHKYIHRYARVCIDYVFLKKVAGIKFLESTTSLNSTKKSLSTSLPPLLSVSPELIMYMHYVSLSYRIIIVYCYGVRHAYNVSPPPDRRPTPSVLDMPLFFAIVNCCVHRSRVESSRVEFSWVEPTESSYCAALPAVRLSIKSRIYCTNNNTFIMKWRAFLSPHPRSLCIICYWFNLNTIQTMCTYLYCIVF